MTLKEKAKRLWQRYQVRRRTDEYEPPWIHPGYELIKKYLDGTIHKDERESAVGIIKSHDLKDGQIVSSFGFEGRVMHDGWKVGTPSWIFMGRKFCEPEIIDNGWIMISRELPDDIAAMVHRPNGARAWMAYHPQLQMGQTAMTSNCIGPSHTPEQVRRIARQEAV